MSAHTPTLDSDLLFVRHTYKEAISGKLVTRNEGDDRPTCDTPRCTCVASHQFDGAQYLCAACADDYDGEEGLVSLAPVTVSDLGAGLWRAAA